MCSPRLFLWLLIYTSGTTSQVNRVSHSCHFDDKSWCVLIGIDSNDRPVFSEKGNSAVTKITYDQSTIRAYTSSTCTTFQQLENLDLKTLSLEVIHENAFEACTELKWLNLHGNKIRNLEAETFFHNTKLEVLFLSGNKLKEINCNLLKYLVKLTELHVASNLLQEFPLQFLQSSVDLVTLSFHSNYLSDFNETLVIKLFPRLRNIWFDGNDLACDRIPAITEAFNAKGIAMNSYHYQRTRFHDTTKVDGYLCLPDVAWSAVHYRKRMTTQERECQFVVKSGKKKQRGWVFADFGNIFVIKNSSKSDWVIHILWLSYTRTTCVVLLFVSYKILIVSPAFLHLCHCV